MPRVYNDDDVKMFAAAIMKDFKGSNVLIVGHSNTLMPLLNAFGAGMPFTTLAEEDYDMLFKVTINNEGEANLKFLIMEISTMYLNCRINIYLK